MIYNDEARCAVAVTIEFNSIEFNMLLELDSGVRVMQEQRLHIRQATV